MIAKPKPALLVGAVRLYNEEKRFGSVRDIDSDIFSRGWGLSRTARLMRQFNSMSLREKNKVRRLKKKLGRQTEAVNQMGKHYAATFSPEGLKLKAFLPGAKLLIRRDPLTVVKILTVVKLVEGLKNVHHCDVQFSSGITGALYIVSGSEFFNNKEAIHLNELTNLSHPTVEDMLWCDRAGVNIQELLHPKA